MLVLLLLLLLLRRSTLLHAIYAGPYPRSGHVVEQGRALQGPDDLVLVGQPEPSLPARLLHGGLQNAPPRHEHVDVLGLVREVQGTVPVQAGHDRPQQLHYPRLPHPTLYSRGSSSGRRHRRRRRRHGRGCIRGLRRLPGPTAAVTAAAARPPCCRRGDNADSGLSQGKVVSHVSSELEAEVLVRIREVFFPGRQVGEQGVSELEGRVEGQRGGDAAAVPEGLRVGGAAVAPRRAGLARPQDEVLVDVFVALLRWWWWWWWWSRVWGLGVCSRGCEERSIRSSQDKFRARKTGGGGRGHALQIETARGLRSLVVLLCYGCGRFNVGLVQCLGGFGRSGVAMGVAQLGTAVSAIEWSVDVKRRREKKGTTHTERGHGVRCHSHSFHTLHLLRPTNETLR